MGARGRDRIVADYSLASVVRRYEETYEEVLWLASLPDRR
jgi:hypothetical protein